MTIAAGLLDLQQRFLLGLERRVSDLTTTLRGSADPESLMRMFHSLAGIGGTYGFPRITDISRQCELLCANVTEVGRTISFAEKKHLRRAVGEIAATAHGKEEAADAA
jgi:HPt (histidine-containing phosphotransfer) domain-containing protein